MRGARRFEPDQCTGNACMSLWADRVSAAPQMGQSKDNSTKPLVVIVDDDPAVRTSLAFLLETEGIAVRGYATGAELLTEVPPAACFIIDYKLPGMSGLDLLAELRNRKIAAPAILITTHPSAAVRKRAATSGTALIEKPLLGDALFNEVRSALSL